MGNRGGKENKHSTTPQTRGKIPDGRQKPSLDHRKLSVLDSDAPQRDLKKEYSLGKKLGEGSYGKVRSATNIKTGERVAIKSVLKKNMRRLHTLRREIGIMKNVDHPNIIKMIDVYEDDSFLHIVMPEMNGGELFDRIIKKGHYSEADAVLVMRQILEAVAYLHSKKISHRDLKPENFLFASQSSNELKLIDFGLSRYYRDNIDMHTRVGTPYYTSPELLARQYDHKCDIWSIGVILYILLAGYPPFYGNSEREIFRMIKAGKYDFPPTEFAGVSDQAKDLIRLMLDINPKTRISAQDALHHPWFKMFEKKHHTEEEQAPPRPLSITGSMRSISGSLSSSTEPAKELDPEVLSRIKAFMKTNRLKRAALGVIVRYLNRKEIESLRQQFKAIDDDGNGVVSGQELAGAMRKVGLNPSSEEVGKILDALDEDGNGRIDYEEFVAASLDKRVYLRDELLETAFQYFDTEGAGVITKKDLEKRLGQEDPLLVHSILKSVDVDHSGAIDFEEFKTMMGSSL